MVRRTMSRGCISLEQTLIAVRAKGPGMKESVRPCVISVATAWRNKHAWEFDAPGRQRVHPLQDHVEVRQRQLWCWAWWFLEIAIEHRVEVETFLFGCLGLPFKVPR